MKRKETRWHAEAKEWEDAKAHSEFKKAKVRLLAGGKDDSNKNGRRKKKQQCGMHLEENVKALLARRFTKQNTVESELKTLLSRFWCLESLFCKQREKAYSSPPQEKYSENKVSDKLDDKIVKAKAIKRGLKIV